MGRNFRRKIRESIKHEGIGSLYYYVRTNYFSGEHAHHCLYSGALGYILENNIGNGRLARHVVDILTVLTEEREIKFKYLLEPNKRLMIGGGAEVQNLESRWDEELRRIGAKREKSGFYNYYKHIRFLIGCHDAKVSDIEDF